MILDHYENHKVFGRTSVYPKEKFMLQILNEIPFFVWPLLAFLIMGGIKASKGGSVPLVQLIAFPAVFFVWALSSFFDFYGTQLLAILLWIFCLAGGFFLGYSHIQKLKLSFDKQKRSVEMPGSWLPLVLSLAVFSAKFAVGIMREVLPELNGSLLFLSLELFAAGVLGVFAGRALGCFLVIKPICTAVIDFY